MIKIFAVEDIHQLRLLEELLEENLAKGSYRLESRPDLSDEGFYHSELPRDFDLYWMHLSAVEVGIPEEIKQSQPWSKIVVRQAMGDNEKTRAYLKKKGIDAILNDEEGLNRDKIIRTFRNLGIE